MYKVGDEVWLKAKIEYIDSKHNWVGLDCNDECAYGFSEIIPSPIAKIEEIKNEWLDGYESFSEEYKEIIEPMIKDIDRILAIVKGE